MDWHKKYASLPLQMMLYYEKYFGVLYYAMSVLIYIGKWLLKWFEVIMLFIFYPPFQFVRIQLGNKGNLSADFLSVICFIIANVLMVIYNVYNMILQVYVLRFELLLNVVSLLFLLLETLFAVLVLVKLP